MQENSTIKVGIFEVPFTKSLRDLFVRTHLKMSSTLPPEDQFLREEQEELLNACLNEDEQQQAANVLELVHYLATNGVSARKMLRVIRTDHTPSFIGETPKENGASPYQLCFRIARYGLAPHVPGSPVYAQSASVGVVTQPSASPLFLAPVMTGASA